MARLRVRQPDTLTRVTEYVPEIVAYVEQIVRNGYGYAVDGSVYFDTHKFDQGKNHFYAKLEPWSKGNRELLEEGEGMSIHSWSWAPYLHDVCPPRLIVVDRRPSISSRFRTVESVKARRAVLGLSVGQRTTRLAHRMFCDGFRHLWRQDGHPLWWH